MFSKTLRTLRAEKGFSQGQLAKAINVSPGNVSDWETDKSKPGYNALAALARIFEVSADYLLELDVSPEKKDIEYLTTKTSKGSLVMVVHLMQWKPMSSLCSDSFQSAIRGDF